ncbi:SGNH/GDSL hydrolase family protein [Mucilaginibacter glaciei]|nr:SGNH/GDSL hydrolase family protein [Mucilaginibacter glaciei]
MMEANKQTKPALTYLALGDSYTIGESVPAEGSFPYQLSAQLTKAGHGVAQPEIIATTGWTTAELIDAISHSDTKGKQYGIVTLLIGVNNQYRGQSPDVYRAEFVQLLNTAIEYAGGDKNHVFVVSIPDWGVTPYAGGRDRAQIGKEIDQFNNINKQEAEKAGVAYADITPISKQAVSDAALTAGDGLHPSAKMYGLWVKEILKVVEPGFSK